jgi:hypothetical protein
MILGAFEYRDHQLLDVGHRLAQTRINCCVISMILVFMSPSEPQETRTLTPTRTTMLAIVLTPRQLARQVGGSVKCDLGSKRMGTGDNVRGQD